MYMRHPQKRKSICSGDVLYWASLVLLAITSLGTVVALQKARKEVQHLSFRLEEAGSSRVHERNLLHSRLKTLEEEVIKAGKERDEIVSSQSKTLEQLKKAQEDVKRAQEETRKAGANSQMALQLRETESRLRKAEKEVKEITVKAGTCQREFASLNANYETVKQDVNNIAQELSSSKGSQASKSKQQQKAKAVHAGELDPRGGMEAAKVLNDELPESETVSNKLQAEHNTIDTDFMRAHPLKVGGETAEQYATDLETSEGLERLHVEPKS